MKNKKTPAPQRAGTDSQSAEFARLALELAVLDPEAFERFAEELQGLADRKPSK